MIKDIPMQSKFSLKSVTFGLISLLSFSPLAFAQTVAIINNMGDGNMLCYQGSAASNVPKSDQINLNGVAKPGFTNIIRISTNNEKNQFAIQVNAGSAACQAPDTYGEGAIGIGITSDGWGYDYTVPPIAAGVTITKATNPQAECGADICDILTYTPPVINTPTYPQAQTYDSGIKYRGVNLAGAEFADDGTGNAAKGMFIPTLQDSAVFLYKGMNTYRLPVAWEYFANIDGSLKDKTSPDYFTKLDKVISDLTKQNAWVVFDIHNYMRYNPAYLQSNYLNHDPNGSDVIGSGSAAPDKKAYYDLWRNIVKRYSDDHMIYDVMNEPHDMKTQDVIDLENLAIQAIRDEEAAENIKTPHLILLEGNYWTGLHSWNGTDTTTTDSTNSQAFIPSNIHDTKNKFAIEIHQYFDNDASGTYQAPMGPVNDCISLKQFQQGYTYTSPYNNQPVTMAGFDNYWKTFTDWATNNKVPVFIGEFGSPDTPNCRADINYMLNAAQKFAYDPAKNTGVIGWTVWAAGNAWGNYVNSIAPGGPANGLMWDNALYQNFLTPPQGATLPTSDSAVKIMQLTNATTNTTLQFSSGDWPFFLEGSATLSPGQTVYLYSPDGSTAPIGKYILTYHLDNDTSNVIGAFVQGNGSVTQSYSFNSYIASLTIGKGTSANQGGPCTISTDSCWVIKDVK